MSNTYKDEIKKCEKLGAVKFQKVVFAVEKIKFKLIKTLFPNSTKWYDKRCDKKCQREIKMAKTVEEKRKIAAKYQEAKMLYRKELNSEENRNYHIDPKRPTEIMKYLRWNKDIHEKGLTKDLILLPVFIGGSFVLPQIFIPLTAIDVLSGAINFECINIQNYNMYRIKEHEAALKRIEAKKAQSDEENFGNAAKVIGKSLSAARETEEAKLPSMKDIIDNIETKEQLLELRKLVQTTLSSRTSSVKSNQMVMK